MTRDETTYGIGARGRVADARYSRILRESNEWRKRAYARTQAQSADEGVCPNGHDCIAVGPTLRQCLRGEYTGLRLGMMPE